MIHVRRTAVRCCPVSLHRVAAAAALLGAQLGASAQQSATPDASAAPEAGKLPTAIELGNKIIEIDINYLDIAQLVEKWSAGAA